MDSGKNIEYLNKKELLKIVGGVESVVVASGQGNDGTQSITFEAFASKLTQPEIKKRKHMWDYQISYITDNFPNKTEEMIRKDGLDCLNSKEKVRLVNLVVSDRSDLALRNAMIIALARNSVVPIDENGNTVFHNAAMSKDSKLIRIMSNELDHRLLSQQINAVNKNGQTPLHLGASTQDSVTITTLVKNGASKYKKNKGGKTPIDLFKEGIAPYDKKTEILLRTDILLSDDDMEYAKRIVGKRAINKRSIDALERPENKKQLEKLFLAASFHGKTSIIKSCLKLGVDIEAEDTNGQTALFKSSTGGHLYITKFLLYNDANPNAIASDGESVLEKVIPTNNSDIAQLLILRGAKYAYQLEYSENMKDVFSYDYTLGKGDEPHIRAALDEKDFHLNPEREFTFKEKSTIFLNACFQNNYHLARKMLHFGASLDISDDINYLTGLHLAAQEGYTDIVDLILAAGGNKSTRDKYGRTPLYLAAKNKNNGIVYRLLEAGANPNIRNIEGKSSLHFAIDYEDDSMLTSLLANKANINAVISKDIKCEDITIYAGSTLFTYAYRTGKYNMAKKLLDNNADPNLPDISGMLPLHYAVLNNDTPFVEILAKQTTEMNMKSRVLTINGKEYEGLTPLHMSLITQNQDIARIIKKNGGDFGKSDSYEECCFDLVQKDENMLLFLVNELGAIPTKNDIKFAKDKFGDTAIFTLKMSRFRNTLLPMYGKYFTISLALSGIAFWIYQDKVDKIRQNNEVINNLNQHDDKTNFSTIS